MIREDCIHYEFCKNECCELLSQIHRGCEQCKNFKDKSLIVELPCKVGDIFFIIAQRFEKGKYTDFFMDERQVSCFEYDGKKLIVYDFSGMYYNIDNIYFEKSKAEAKLKELKK